MQDNSFLTSKQMTEEEENKKEHLGQKVDKLVVGAIIGGAIGSVLGLTLAPKEGKKTRKAIAEKSKELIDGHRKEIKTAAKLTKETAYGLYKLLRNTFRKK